MPREVIVIGAGIIGASIAWHLAKAGAKVWVIVRRSGSELTTQSYGLIRDP